MKTPAALIVLLTASAAWAQAGPGTWSDPAGLPVPAGYYNAMASAPDRVFVLVQKDPYALRLFDLSVPTGTWTERALLNTSTISSTGLAWNPTNARLYALVMSSGGEAPTFAEFDPAAPEAGWTVKAAIEEGNPSQVASMACSAGRIYVLCDIPAGDPGSAFWEYLPGPGVGGGDWTFRTKLSWRSSRSALASPQDGVVYAIRGNATTEVYKGVITAGLSSTWSKQAGSPLPSAPVLQPTLTHAGGGVLVATVGTNATRLLSLDTAVGGPWLQRSLLPATLDRYGAFTWDGGTRLYGLRGDDASDFWTYSIPADAFESGLAMTPGFVGGGSSLLSVDDGDSLYLIAGGGSTEFLRYSAAADAWTPLEDLPEASASFSAMVAIDGGRIVAAVNGVGNFIYSIAGDAWTPMAGFSFKMVRNGQFRHDGSRYLYFPTTAYLDGGAYYLERYDLLQDPRTAVWTFQEMAAPPAVFNGNDWFDHGNSMTFGPDGLLYALRGNDTSTFWTYAPHPVNAWNVRLNEIGVAVEFDPSDPTVEVRGSHLSAPTGLQGLISLAGDRLGRYSIPLDAWEDLAALPAEGGVASAWPGAGKFCYVLRGGGSRQLWRYQLAPIAPTLPAAALEQTRWDGLTSIDAGATTSEPGFVAKVDPASAEGHRFRLDVEVQAAEAPFSGEATRSGSFVAGAAAVLVDGLGSTGAYHWQARLTDLLGYDSGWIPFGNAVDFRTRVNYLPAAGEVRQSKMSDGAPFPVGGWYYGQEGIVLQAALNDANAGDSVRIEVEIREAGTPFTGEATAVSDPVAPGETAELRVPLGYGRYAWRFRPTDDLDKAAWIEFGGNAPDAVDFELRDRGGSVNAAGGGCLQAAAGGAAAWPLLLALLLLRRK